MKRVQDLPGGMELPMGAVLTTTEVANLEQALDLINRARARLAERPAFSLAISQPLVTMSLAELDTARELLVKALLPW